MKFVLPKDHKVEIPVTILREAGLKAGDELEWRVKHGKVIIRRVNHWPYDGCFWILLVVLLSFLAYYLSR